MPTALEPTPKPIICAGCLYCAGRLLNIGSFLTTDTPIPPFIAPLADTPPNVDVLARLVARVALRVARLTVLLAALRRLGMI